MSDMQKNQNLKEELDLNEEIIGTGDELDLGGDQAGFDPFGDDLPEKTETAVCEQQPKADDSEAVVPDAKPAVQKGDKATSENPFEAAINAAETKQAQENQAGLINKLPVFSYANANAEIVDTSITFEDLRVEKKDDFPELEEENRVSWTIEYGKLTKPVSKPKDTTIAKMKSEIETSKEFLDSLKKVKGEIVCKVKPHVTAQKKGEMPSYKGIFTNLESAAASGRPICIVPSNDGHVYEIRNNEIGQFAAKAPNIKELSEIRAGFKPALPPLPFEFMCRIITFFRSFMGKEIETEALVNVYWDKIDGRYHLHVPKQTVSKGRVDTIVPELDEDRFIHVADVHSHNSMAARFSAVDDNDEKATRIYIVLGRLNKLFPDIAARVSCGGRFVDIDPSLVIENVYMFFPPKWLEQVNMRIV